MNPTNVRPQVLQLIAKPRTVPQIKAALPEVPKAKIETALWNACKRGLAVNLWSDKGRKCGGLFVAVEQRAPIRAEFSALCEVWK